MAEDKIHLKLSVNSPTEARELEAAWREIVRGKKLPRLAALEQGEEAIMERARVAVSNPISMATKAMSLVINFGDGNVSLLGAATDANGIVIEVAVFDPSTQLYMGASSNYLLINQWLSDSQATFNQPKRSPNQ